MPAQLPHNLIIGAICSREDVRDALVSKNDVPFLDLPKGARIGTSSLRRQVQLRALRPDLTFFNLRGNVPTRVGKLDAGEYDAIVLAAAGLKRLGLTHKITQFFSVAEVLPACGQGALGIECREDDLELREILHTLHEVRTAACVEAERAMNAVLGGSCQIPIAALAQYENRTLRLTGRVGDLKGLRLVEASASGILKHAEKIGKTVAAALVQQGAKQIIDEILQYGS
jgi:hydroxymethylbilane synthase